MNVGINTQLSALVVGRLSILAAAADSVDGYLCVPAAADSAVGHLSTPAAADSAVGHLCLPAAEIVID